MGSCCGPCSAATRLCSSSSSSSREVKMFLLMPSLSLHLLDPVAPTHPHYASPAVPATASIRVHAVRDGGLCPHGGEGHIPALLPLWSPNLFREKKSLSKSAAWEGGGAHLRVTVVGGRAPQRRPNLAFSVEAQARSRWLSGRTSVGIAGAGRRGPVAGQRGQVGGRAGGEGGAAREPVSSTVRRHDV
jgi:hypothetical protein